MWIHRYYITYSYVIIQTKVWLPWQSVISFRIVQGSNTRVSWPTTIEHSQTWLTGTRFSYAFLHLYVVSTCLNSSVISFTLLIYIFTNSDSQSLPLHMRKLGFIGSDVFLIRCDEFAIPLGRQQYQCFVRFSVTAKCSNYGMYLCLTLESFFLIFILTVKTFHVTYCPKYFLQKVYNPVCLFHCVFFTLFPSHYLKNRAYAG